MDPIRLTISEFWNGPVQWDCPMGRYSTLKVGGEARAVMLPANQEELATLVAGLTGAVLRWEVIGRGSNILVPDSGYDGVVIVLGAAFAGHKIVNEVPGKVEIEVGGGCGLPRLVRWCMEQGLAGLEFAEGIPGSVGGAVRMNAGAYGSQMADWLTGATLMDRSGKLVELGRDRLDFGYRQLRNLDGRIVVAARFALTQDDREAITARCEAFRSQRASKQPAGVASAGSFFKNPPNDSAGRLIDAAGLKGFQVGGARVSEVHANFLVNAGGATATDILSLMRHVQAAVLARHGVSLEPEVQILGGEMRGGGE